MTLFEFTLVFISIIFGVGVTHLLTGAVQQLFRGGFSFLQLAYAVLTLIVLVLNWWTLFLWRDHAPWTFEVFFVLVIWALAFFSLAVAVFPPGQEGEASFDTHRRTYLWIFISAMLLDVVQTAIRGQLFTPWYYLPYIVHFAGVCLLAIFLRSERLQRVIAIYMPVSVLIWSFTVRHLLA